MWDPDELIVAPATVTGPGVRSVVRISGARLDDLLGTLLLLPDPLPPGPRALAATLHPRSLGAEWGTVAVRVLRWPGPAGPTGGPLAEIQLPCSPPLVDAVVAEARRLGARAARGGEFTVRGFLAGKIDLVQAEAVLAVVDARSPEELSAALDRLAGGAGTALGALREALLDVTADVEAAIDFADEHGTGVDRDAFWQGLSVALAAARGLADEVASRGGSRDAGARARLPRVVLCGPPNVGKSSLFNALAGRPAALVADEPGTTRDWLEAEVHGGGPAGTASWILVDTAGVAGAAAPTDAGPDAEAARRAVEEVRAADVVVRCRDAQGSDRRTPAPPGPFGRTAIDVLTRCDLASAAAPPTGAVAVSCVTGEGIGLLTERIAAAVAALPPRDGGAAHLRAGVEDCRAALVEAEGIVGAALDTGHGEEPLLAAVLLRAIAALDQVTGASIGTDLLDRIFSRHCVGK